MYLPALPELPAALSSTSSAAQLTLSACIIGLAVGQLITGPLSDRLGRRGPLLIGVALFVVASVICAVTTSMTVLIAVRFVQGAAGAAGIVVGRAVVADMFAGKAAAAYFSAIATINGLAPILAPVIGGQVLRVGTWRTVFWVLAGVGVVLLMLSAVVHQGNTAPSSVDPAGASAAPCGRSARCWRDRGYVGAVLAGSMVTAAMFGYISASPFVLQDRFGLSAQWFSACFALNAIGIVLATQIGRILLRWTTSFVLLTVGVVQALLGAVLLTVTVLAGWGLVMMLVSLFVMVSAVGFALPHASAIAMDRHRRDRRLGVGVARVDPVRARRGDRAAGRHRRRHQRARDGRRRADRDTDRGGRAAVRPARRRRPSAVAPSSGTEHQAGGIVSPS